MAGSFEIIAAFHDERRAKRVADDLACRGLPRSHLKLVKPNERGDVRVADMRAEGMAEEMQDEVTHSMAGPGVGLMTSVQAKGAAIGTILGALVGLLIGLAVGAIWGWGIESAISPVGRLLITAACFGVGGAVAGAVAGGSMNPSAEAAEHPGNIEAADHPGKMMDESRLAGELDTLLEVRVNDENEASMVLQVLESAGAERVNAADEQGRPFLPEHDPSGY